jgi:MCP family monocarboxylic acid transporter-like MFS transporter 14
MCSGIGLGLLYLPNVIAVSYYFQDRRALATGIAVCGSGVGCFIFAPLGEYLLQTYAWKSAMLIVAGITLQGCLFSSLLRPLEPKVKPPQRPRAKNWFDRFCERTGLRKKTTNEQNKEHDEIAQVCRRTGTVQ